ncbi:MAG: GDP-mannose 4,6-dehydratase [Candidatus Omnitrophica bacterium]|nr:GDP-mannose 4,6-dehydratase [Candidatus Omnitrophota bacterium]
MSKVAVIGSNSFSGSDFIDLLLEDPRYEVVGLSRSPEKSALFLPYKRRRSPKFRFRKLDMNRKMSEILGVLDSFRPEWVVNFATQSEVAPSWEHPEHWFETNCVAFAKLVNHLKDKNYLKRYLHISTPEVYGHCRGAVREDAALNPSTPYAVSRVAQDHFLKILHERFGFPVVTVRSANVYGAHQQLWKIIPRSVIYAKMGRKIKLHGGGNSKRSFIHIRDVSKGELAVLEHGLVGSVYHLSTEKVHEIREVVRQVCASMGRSFKAATCEAGERLGQDNAYLLDIRKSKKDLGWSPSVFLEQGIREVIQWVEKNWEAIQTESLEYAHTP